MIDAEFWVAALDAANVWTHGAPDHDPDETAVFKVGFLAGAYDDGRSLTMNPFLGPGKGYLRAWNEGFEIGRRWYRKTWRFTSSKNLREGK